MLQTLQAILTIYFIAYGVTMLVDLWVQPHYDDNKMWYFVCSPFVFTIFYVTRLGFKDFRLPMLFVYPILAPIFVLRDFITNIVLAPLALLFFWFYVWAYQLSKLMNLGQYTGILMYLKTIRIKTKYTVSSDSYDVIVDNLKSNASQLKKANRNLEESTARHNEYEKLINIAILEGYSGDILADYITNNMKIYDAHVKRQKLNKKQQQEQKARELKQYEQDERQYQYQHHNIQNNYQNGYNNNNGNVHLSLSASNYNRQTGYNDFGVHQNGKYNEKFDKRINGNLGYAS